MGIFVFGSELRFGNANWRARAFYRVFGHDHMGMRVRGMHLIRSLRRRRSRTRSVLDAGSGEGCYSFILSRMFPQAMVLGVDVDPDRIIECRGIADRLGRDNLKFEIADLTRWESSERFDLIVSVDVLEHIEADEAALQTLKRSLRPEGLLLLHLPYDYDRCRTALAPFYRAMRGGHVRPEYTPEEVRDKLSRAGLRVEKELHTFGTWGAVARSFGYRVNGFRRGRWLARLLTFPLLLILARLDTLGKNERFQGMLFHVRHA